MISPRVATSIAQSLFDRMYADQKKHQQQQTDHDEQAKPTSLDASERRKESEIKPDSLTYSSMIYLFAQHGLAARAESVLNQLYSEYSKSQDDSLKPDVQIFTSVLLAWSKSDEPNAAERAEAILRRMQELSDCGVDLEPDLATYTVCNSLDFMPAFKALLG